MANAQFNIRTSESFRSQLEHVATQSGESQNACLHRLVAEAASALGWRAEVPKAKPVPTRLGSPPVASGTSPKRGTLRLAPRKVPA